MSDDAFKTKRKLTTIIEGKLWTGEDKRAIIKKMQSSAVANKVKTITKKMNEAGVPCFRCLNAYSCAETAYDDLFIIMEYVYGEHVEISKLKVDVALDIAKEIGVNIARMHSVLKTIENISDIFQGDLYKDYKQSLSIIKEQGVNVDDKILRECEFQIDKIVDLPRQLIHRDVQSRNMLFNGSKLIAFLDFDSCEENVRIYDIVYYYLRTIELNFRCLGTNIEFWHAYFIAILKGYESVMRLTRSERDMLFPLLLCLQICFIAYFICTSNDQDQIVEQLTILEWIYKNKKEFELY